MKIDPHDHKGQYLKWKENNDSIQDVSDYNSKLIMQYLEDMEKGINISNVSVKGPRSYARLLSLKNRLAFFARQFYISFNLNRLTEIKEEQLIGFFSDMKKGVIKRDNGIPYKSVDTYAKIFKAFWHWYQKVERKQSNKIPDITFDLDTSGTKPEWVYLNDSQVKLLCNKATYDYRALITFLFDSGIRSPTELINVKVADLYNNCKELHIREEISKTFGRKIKLMLCSQLLKEYIENKQLKQEDYLFPIDPASVNQQLKRLAKRILGNKKSPAGQKYSDLTMYDFRHCSCCYWLPRYKSESALKYRFGWKKSDMIHYYSELLGMKDTITEEDMLIDVTKTEIEKRLAKTEREKEILKEKLKVSESKMAKMKVIVDEMYEEMKSKER